MRWLRYLLILALLTPAWASFTHVQTKAGNCGSNTTCSLVLTSTPTTGNLVVYGVVFVTTISALTVKDSNNNTYTVTPNSPEIGFSGCANCREYLAYLLSAPSNATATITATWTGSSASTVFADEFSSTGGAVSFDNDVTGSGTGTAVNSPTITPAGSGELLWAVVQPANDITAPTAGSSQGVWTGGAIQNSSASEYDLSAASATAVNFTESPTGGWGAMAMAFKQASATHCNSCDMSGMAAVTP